MVDGIFDSHAHYDDDAFDADRDGCSAPLGFPWGTPGDECGQQHGELPHRHSAGKGI